MAVSRFSSTDPAPPDDDVSSVLPSLRASALLLRPTVDAADNLVGQVLACAGAEIGRRPANATLSQWLHGIMARFASADPAYPPALKFTSQGREHI
jgi:hypothetical protein